VLAIGLVRLQQLGLVRIRDYLYLFLLKSAYPNIINVSHANLEQAECKLNVSNNKTISQHPARIKFTSFLYTFNKD